MTTKRLICALLLVVLAGFGLPRVDAQAPASDKWGIINTRRSQAGQLYHAHYTQEANEAFGFSWYHDYFPDNVASRFPSANRLYTVWRPSDLHTPEQIQTWARDARQFMGDGPVYWVLGNEPNLADQANITPQDYAPLYRKYHENLKAGDPAAIILGPSLYTAPSEFFDWGTSDYVYSPKRWYDAFRDSWQQTPELRAYSQSVNGTDYPPLDAFSIHLYYRNAAETIDAFNRVHADVSNYPEIADKSITITEIGDLGWVNQPMDDFVNELIDWSITEDRLERAYWFYMHEDQGPDWPQTILIDESDTVTSVGQIFIDRFGPIVRPDPTVTPVPSTTMGDVDCSDSMTIADAVLIAQFIVGTRTDSGGCPVGNPLEEIDTTAADVNNDNAITEADALLLTQCLVNIPSLLCP